MEQILVELYKNKLSNKSTKLFFKLFMYIGFKPFKKALLLVTFQLHYLNLTFHFKFECDIFWILTGFPLALTENNFLSVQIELFLNCSFLHLLYKEYVWDQIYPRLIVSFLYFSKLEKNKTYTLMSFVKKLVQK
jgi:hypothetical protein